MIHQHFAQHVYALGLCQIIEFAGGNDEQVHRVFAVLFFGRLDKLESGREDVVVDGLQDGECIPDRVTKGLDAGRGELCGSQAKVKVEEFEEETVTTVGSSTRLHLIAEFGYQGQALTAMVLKPHQEFVSIERETRSFSLRTSLPTHAESPYVRDS